MEALRSPKHKVILVSVLLLLLAFAASRNGIDAGGTARWILGLAAVVGGVMWFRRTRKVSARFPIPTRLEVVSRVGLSPRCGLALVCAEGRSYLVVHGDGYAEITEMPAAHKLRARHGAPSGRSCRRLPRKEGTR